MLSGDAHPAMLVSSLEALAVAEGGRYRIDLLKAPHHGSAKNLTRRMVEIIDCHKLAISTNGQRHGHPDPETIARFIHFGSTGTKDLYFNYYTERSRPWSNPEIMEKYNFRFHAPSVTQGLLTIDI